MWQVNMSVAPELNSGLVVLVQARGGRVQQLGADLQLQEGVHGCHDSAHSPQGGALSLGGLPRGPGCLHRRAPPHTQPLGATLIKGPLSAAQACLGEGTPALAPHAGVEGCRGLLVLVFCSTDLPQEDLHGRGRVSATPCPCKNLYFTLQHHPHNLNVASAHCFQPPSRRSLHGRDTASSADPVQQSL